MNDRNSGEIRAFARLAMVVRELRQKCPWDREQTLKSLTKYLIEEAYEATDAIERGGAKEIAGELGDIFAQVLFAANIAEEKGQFTLTQLIEEAADKLVRRHPHVFGEVEAESSAEVVANWERIKQAERKSSGAVSALDDVARALPALMRAEKLGKRARQAGMDWADIHAVLAKVREEMDEVEGALARNDPEGAAEELGDMLLALANAPRFIEHDAEETLRRACDKFVTRFQEVERRAAAQGLELAKMSEPELEELWQKAKRSAV
jgi:MazG family protein